MDVVKQVVADIHLDHRETGKLRRVLQEINNTEKFEQDLVDFARDLLRCCNAW